MAAGARAVLRRLGAPRRRAGAGRDPRGIDPPPPRGEGRPRRGRAPGAGGDLRRPGAEPGRVGDRDRLPRPRAARRRSLRASRHELAPGRPPSPHRVRPRRDHPLGARPAARQAVVLEHRLRARAGDLHAERAPRRLHGGARLRRLGDEPQARADPPRRARPDGWPPRLGAGRRAARRGVRASPIRRSRSPTRSPPCARRTCGRPGPARPRTRAAFRVEQRLGRHLALDPVAEDLDGDARADRRHRRPEGTRRRSTARPCSRSRRS